MNRMIIAGGSGFLGQALTDYFLKTGWEVAILTRSPDAFGVKGRPVGWDARTVGSWQAELERATALINLTGKSVNCRYTKRNREEILSSRVESTGALGEAIRRSTKPPMVWLNASTATIYRHTLGAPWDERGEVGPTPEAKDRFSVKVARAWEEALMKAATPQTRKVMLRTAMVLGAAGNSVFPTLRRLTRRGLGGSMGNGRQFVSWIHQTDFCRAIDWIIGHAHIENAVNVSAPLPVSNREMMRTLRQVCRMPFGLPSSRWMLEIGAFFLRTETELIIKSRRVIPSHLVASGFQFQFPEIRAAFDDLNR